MNTKIKSKVKSKVNKKSFLSKIFLFSYLSDELIDKIASVSNVIELKKEELLFSEGDVADKLFIIIYGKLSIFKISRQGEEQPIHFQSSFDLVAEAAIFDKKIYPAFCKALQNSLVLSVPRDELISLIKKNPDVALKLLASYSKRLREFVSMVEYLTLNDAKERLIRYLIKNAKDKSEDVEDVDSQYVVELQTSKKELAAILGTAAETLSRTLKILKEEGIISVSEESATSITILNYHQLKKQYNF
ncbi:MAG: Crp/Fnr family transcriptional regulator [Oligoflexia bacterium]|nr:Crp/Fnr family transcriptional regulator [Oligoflexia bacterium]